jgi:molecular chaperone GrpE (heat shock protein)
MEGIRAIYNSVLVIFRNNEVKEIPARGTFNPKFQTAVGSEVRNDLPPGTIISIQRRGFMLGKKILRTPEVVISKRSDFI